ncbi:hypothetical protein B9P78_05510 [Aerococcus sp. 1KP-2016]|nr:hypothetical protein B9P78_05510 [Aerococcus sp. 1KP-2016]
MRKVIGTSFTFSIQILKEVNYMPFVRIQLKSGRTPEQKAVIAKEIIDAMDKHDFATRDSIKVIFEDMLPENFITDADLSEK